jgi:formylglycine-generating enzyme required for sulfatase activity
MAQVKVEFVNIPAGEFMMGCAPTDSPNMPDGTYSKCDDDEKPSHRVRIAKAFEMGKYEVTQAQWELVMGANPSFFKGPDRPVEQVTWDQVEDFIGKLNARQDGYRYRLPTEAEWEYAARAGSSGAFPDPPSLSASAWYNPSGSNVTEGETRPVGQKQPNVWGLYDIRGNVAEWVQDWYSASYYQQSPQNDPQGPKSGRYHLTRGGSYHGTAHYLRASDRYQCACASRRDIGIRLVREPR